ncbi:hypothetical protein [Paraburkholderia guartelaensis]|uniref:Uncharacterized protein n=1 Tax=Paraburkholderia guartelaensis TaxID=2546446 RepID=A0ABU9SEU4_9BURK
MSENVILNGGMLVVGGVQAVGVEFNAGTSVFRSTSTMVTSSFAGIADYEGVLVGGGQQVAGGAQQVEHFDYMFRFRTDAYTQSIVGNHWETAEFVRVLQSLAMERSEEVDLLKSFAEWQKNKLDYSAVYTAWLLEAMSDEEFEEESSKYVVEIDDRDPRKVADVAERLVRLLPFELSTSEIADYLRAEPRSVLEAIAQFGQHSDKLRALLPADKQQLPSE